MINTYSESQLHKTLKEAYAKKYNGNVEQEINGKICDIIAPDGTIVEIQTGSLSKLVSKVATLTPRFPFRIVFPLVTTKYIETRDTNGTVLSYRKSPKKQTIYSIFRELSSLHPFLLNNNLTIEILESEITEIRIKTTEPVQLANKSRRFRKNWYKQDKKLNAIKSVRLFHSAQDYLSLLPDNLPDSFCVQDVAERGVNNQAGCMVWVLRKIGLIEFAGKQGRKNYYKKTAPETMIE